MVEGRVCKVCSDKSDGAHFGVDTCRACAAFFRRSIVMKKKYICRQGAHACVISKSVRCMCRACRFRKCVKAGMSRDGVQSQRDFIGPRDGENGLENGGADCNAVDTAITSSSGVNGVNDIPILPRLQQGYRTLVEKRSHYFIQSPSPPEEYRPFDGFNGSGFGHVLPPPNICPGEFYSTNYQPIKHGRRAVFVEHTEKLLTIDYPNIVEYAKTSFPRINELPCEQTRKLFKAFFHLFLFIEGGCRSAKVYPDRTDRLVISDGNYIDISNLAGFFNRGDMPPEEAEKTFRTSFELFVQGLLKPLLIMKPTELEVIALVALSFYSIGLEGTTDHTMHICREVQDQIFRELSCVYAQNGVVEPALRLARLTMLMPALQRISSRHWEDILISKIFITNYNDVLYRLIAP